MSSTTRLRGLAATTAAMSLVVGFGGMASAETTPTATPSATPSATAAPSATPTAETTPTAAATPAPAETTPAAATTPAPGGSAASPMLAAVPTTDPRCATTTPLTLFNINDFHGRILTAGKLFTPVEELRATQADVVLASAGDNVGASIFESFINNDDPAIDILNAAKLAVSAPGNHEFDKGLADFQGHIETRAAFDYVAANMTGTDMAPYKVVTTASGIRVAYIGAEVSELAGLVDMTKMSGVTVSPEVAAVNTVADQIRAAGAADVIVAEVHNNLQTGYNANVDVVFNGHTHQTYAITNADGIPVVQAGQYGEKLGRVDLAIGAGNVICGTPTPSVVTPPANANTALPAIAEIEAIASAARTAAAGPGSQVIGQACTNITRGGVFDAAQGKVAPENRQVESTASDMVADAFFDIGGGDPNTVIGMQNPGGTRADVLAGEVTYAEAAAVLPFANTIMTTQITGAQLKTVLEQQWQPAGSSRPYLQLGLSDNVTYTYDESLAAGNRITGVYVNGAPVDPAKLYTIVSGSFLIGGGDNFTELGAGINKTDTGKSDLEAFVNWVKVTRAGNLCPQLDRQAVSFTMSVPAGSALACGTTSTYTLGQPLAAETAVAKDTLNFTNSVPVDQTVTVYGGDQRLGTATITDGVANVSLTVGEDATGGVLRFVTTNGTTVYANGVTVPNCQVAVDPAPAPTPTPTPEPTPGPLYPNCQAAIDAGAAPVQLGDPGYGPHLDADGDGVGCEITSNGGTNNPPKLANTGAGDGVVGLAVLGALALSSGAVITRRR